MLEGFVYIVESPSPEDLLSDQVEGRALCGALQLARIPHVYSLATDLQTFRTAMGSKLVHALQTPAIQGRRPILHLSMHGDDGGIGLTSGEYLTWDALQDELGPLQSLMRGGLLITMSSCFGIAGCRMAMNTSTSYPFWALVGHSGSVDWSDAAIAYITFYHQFFKETSLERCVELMRLASGDLNFMYLPGHAIKSTWVQTTAGLLPPPSAGAQSQATGGGLLSVIERTSGAA